MLLDTALLLAAEPLTLPSQSFQHLFRSSGGGGGTDASSQFSVQFWLYLCTSHKHLSSPTRCLAQQIGESKESWCISLSPHQQGFQLDVSAPGSKPLAIHNNLSEIKACEWIFVSVSFSSTTIHLTINNLTVVANLEPSDVHDGLVVVGPHPSSGPLTIHGKHLSAMIASLTLSPHQQTALPPLPPDWPSSLPALPASKVRPISSLVELELWEQWAREDTGELALNVCHFPLSNSSPFTDAAVGEPYTLVCHDCDPCVYKEVSLA
jgi:hypothetical protein